MDSMEIFRANTRAIIEKRALIQAEVARRIDETPQKLNGFLNGHIGWGEVKQRKLAKFLKIDYLKLCSPDFKAEIDNNEEQSGGGTLDTEKMFMQVMQELYTIKAKCDHGHERLAALEEEVDQLKKASGRRQPSHTRRSATG